MIATRLGSGQVCFGPAWPNFSGAHQGMAAHFGPDLPHVNWPWLKIDNLMAHKLKQAFNNISFYGIILLKTVDTFTLPPTRTLNNRAKINICYPKYFSKILNPFI